MSERDERVAGVLEIHTYVIDGPPSPCGFRCPCGEREATHSPESADRAARMHVAKVVLAALADDPAQVTLARVEALRVRWATATGNAKDFDYGRWFRAAATELRAALVPGHDHEGGK